MHAQAEDGKCVGILKGYTLTTLKCHGLGSACFCSRSQKVREIKQQVEPVTV